MNQTIPYGRQQILDEDIHAVVEVLKSNFLTQGPAVEIFEKSFAKYVGAKHAIAVNNGTAALHLAALALGVNQKTKVLCTPLSFVASANCILYCGGEIEFTDVSPVTACIDLELLSQKLSSVPRGTYSGVIAVDLAGYPVASKKLQDLCRTHGAWLIEDACHAVGAEFLTPNGWKKSGCGEFSDIAVFSFHPVKHLTTGEGGMITTNNDELARKMRLLRTHGITKNPAEMSQVDGPWYYEMQELGYNYRIPDILCALGSSQLSRIEKNLSRRREIARYYDEQFSGIHSLQTPVLNEDIRHGYHLYVLRHPQRDEIFRGLQNSGISCQVHYIPIHLQPYYRRMKTWSMPAAEHYYKEALSIPMYHAMTDHDAESVAKQVKSLLEKFGPMR